MTEEFGTADDAGTVRHRIMDAIEGFREQMKDPSINAAAREAITPMLTDGLVIAMALTADQNVVAIPQKVMHQADVWLSHAEPLLERLKA
jgi:hypothetical protein